MDVSDASSDDEPVSRPGLGTSSSAALPKSTSRPLSPSSSDSEISSASEDFQDHKSGLPSSFGGAKARFRKRRKVLSNASTSQASKPEATDPGEWERHTRGIASKILAKHGFTGRLGKRADGIAAPIQPVFRPEKLGLGAGGFSEKGEAAEAEEAVERAEKETLLPKRQRRKRNDDAYDNAFDKVIDMREALPHEVPSVAAVLKSDRKAEAVSKQEITDRLFAAPEVLYNLQMLADNARMAVTKAQQRKDTEALIMQSAVRQLRNSEEQAEGAKQAIAYVSKLESLLDTFARQGKAADQQAFEDCLKQIENIQKVAKANSFVNAQLISAAFTEVVYEHVEQEMANCLLQSEQQGKADKKQVKNMYKILTEVRKSLDPVSYTKLCTLAILAPLRKHISRPTWDAVRGACAGDIMSWMRRILPEALIKIFAEEVLVPKLLSRLKRYHTPSLIQTETEVPAHVWIHPWLPATGRLSLVEVIQRVRVSLSKSLQDWHPIVSSERRSELVSLVTIWSKVLSHRKLQLSLSRYITPKLGRSLIAMTQEDYKEVDVKRIIEDIAAWSEVGSVRLLAKDLIPSFLNGPGRLLQKEAFGNDDWTKAKEVYLLWTQRLPTRLKEFMRPALAALLFVLHAARVTTDQSIRRRLQHADLSPLLKNTFEKLKGRETQREKKQRSDDVARREPHKARLADVLEMIGKREGLVVVGLGEERGMRVFRVGDVRVVLDVERNVFVVRGEVVDIGNLVRLAKGG